MRDLTSYMSAKITKIDEIPQKQDREQGIKKTENKTLKSKMNEEDQVQVKECMVRETVGPEIEMSQKLRDEEHSNLFIQPNTDKISTMSQALL